MHYLSCDLHPVAMDDLQRFLAGLTPSLRSIGAHLLAGYPPSNRGLHRLHICIGEHHIILDLLFEEARAAFAGLSMPAPMVDAWFLDGFSPVRNTDIWHKSLFGTLAGLSREQATLSSYTVAGEVRRNLEHAGFIVVKTPGFGKKREMLQGRMPSRQPVHSNIPRQHWACPWPDKVQKIGHTAVIGAGLAGCATAHALAKRGLRVTLIEKHAEVASEASGNPRGIVHFSPARQLTPGNRFRLAAFQFAVRQYRALALQAPIGWEPCGLMQVALSPADIAHSRDLLDRQLYPDDFLHPPPRLEVDRKDSPGEYQQGLWFPMAGSLSPPELCRAWIDTPGITLLADHDLENIVRRNDHWEVSVRHRDSKSRLEFDALVICTGASLPDADWLPPYPLSWNHGQTDTYTLEDDNAMPSFILRHQGYVIPWRDGRQAKVTIGGNVLQGKTGTGNGHDDWEQNLRLIARFCPQLAATLGSNQTARFSRSGTRTSTPDYLPVAGPVEDRKVCESLFAPLARNARKAITTVPEYLPGLYINTGYGSSGLVTAPLVGDYLASLITATTAPMPEDIIAAIHPLRFLIRDMKKQRRD